MLLLIFDTTHSTEFSKNDLILLMTLKAPDNANVILKHLYSFMYSLYSGLQKVLKCH